MTDSLDKQTLLNELRIDRTAPARRRIAPLAALVGIGVAVGIALVVWLVDFGPGESPAGAASAGSASTAPSTASTGGASSTSSPPSTPAAAAPVQQRDASVLDATGYVVARRQATVSAQVTGQVVEVLIEEGQRVEEGQLLARLDDAIPRAQYDLVEAQLASARATLTEIDVQIRQAALDLERTGSLSQRNLASQADLDRNELTLEAVRARRAVAERQIVVAERSLALQRRALADLEVRAPFAGIVVAKAAQPGEIISPMSAGGGFTRTGICTIVDMESLEVEVDVNEAYINRVAPGQPVRVALNAYPDEPLPAEVIAIIPTADRNKATVRVRVRLLGNLERVLPDMGVRVAFLTAGEDTK